MAGFSSLMPCLLEVGSTIGNCDLPRRNHLDGRGTLREEALAEFTRFFLTVYTGQVNFMESLVQPDRLRARILIWAQEEIRLGRLPARSDHILEAVHHSVLWTKAICLPVTRGSQ
jgi:hypothetical protein